MTELEIKTIREFVKTFSIPSFKELNLAQAMKVVNIADQVAQICHRHEAINQEASVLLKQEVVEKEMIFEYKEKPKKEVRGSNRLKR